MIGMDDRPGGRDEVMSVTVDDADVVRLTWVAGLHIDEALAREAMKAVDEVNGERRRPLLVAADGPVDMSRGARHVLAEPCSATRVAVLGQSAVDQIVVNFMLRLTSPAVPTRLFTSEPAATAWLHSDRSSG